MLAEFKFVGCPPDTNSLEFVGSQIIHFALAFDCFRTLLMPAVIDVLHSQQLLSNVKIEAKFSHNGFCRKARNNASVLLPL